MNADQWRRAKDLFHAALERAPEERAEFVGEACGGDAALQAEVGRLLAAHAEAGSFIEHSPVSNRANAAGSMQGRPPLTGRVIGRYEVGRLLGVGGMGAVYAARDRELRREVALKVGSDRDLEGQARLRREAQHASQLNHPHICTIYEVGIADGQAYIAMEYVEGERLADMIPRDGLDLEHLLRYGTQIADGLAHAHAHGISHRDLKSENVVITPDGRAKILDFGLARRLPAERLKELSESRASMTAEAVVAGTLSAMAPELLRGEPADERSDIWALGVLLYEVAAGVRPFTGATGFELSGAILHQAPAPLPAHIPASFQTVVQTCLEKNPHARYQSAKAVRVVLEALEKAEATDGASRVSSVIVDRASLLSRCWRHRFAWMLAIILAYGAYRVLRPGDRPVAISASGRPAIAVMHFDTIGSGREDDITWMSSGVPSMLLTGLAQTSGLEIVSAQRLHDVLKQRGGTSLSSLDRTEAADVARRAGAGAVVVGSIFRSGKEIRIDAQLEALSSGRVLAAESVRGTDVFALVDQLAGEIRDAMGVRNASEIRNVADVSSASLEAYRLYSEGMNAYYNVRFDDARQSLDAAVARDPTFAQAHLGLTYLHEFDGRAGARRHHLQEAAKRSDRLTERERLLVELMTAREAANSVKAVLVLDELIERFPAFENAYVSAALLYDPVVGVVPNTEKYVGTLARGVQMLPTVPGMRNLYAYALLSTGRVVEAIRELETSARLAPREPNPYDSLGEAHLILGVPDKAIDYYSRALMIDPTFLHPPAGRAWAYAMLGRYEQALAENIHELWVKALLYSRVGRYREASQLVAAARSEAEDRQNFATHGALYLQSALMALERREYRLALKDVRAAEQVFRRLPHQAARPYLVSTALIAGLGEVGLGNLVAARAQVVFQEGLYNPASDTEKWSHRALEGEISLAAGDLQTAATQFSSGQPPGKMAFAFLNGPLPMLGNSLLSRDGLARVQKARGDLDGAIHNYRRLLTVGLDQKWTAPLEPRYVLEIAKLLDKKGEKTAARAEYERFLELWKNADADVPEPGEARRALARLR